jgi:hypothetical protein
VRLFQQPQFLHLQIVRIGAAEVTVVAIKVVVLAAGVLVVMIVSDLNLIRKRFQFDEWLV